MARDLSEKTFLITGGTEGIGKAAALNFAQRGAKLTLVARSREKGERVRSELIAASGNDQIDLIFADLCKLADMRAVAAEFQKRRDRLDVLVNNAGAIFNRLEHSADGFEMTFALNHLSYFLLSRELLPLLRKTPGARVVSTSSGAHAIGKVDFDDLAKRPSRKTGFNVYGDSKLLNILFTRELARRLAGSSATANCFHPGFVHTGFGQNNKGVIAVAIKLTASLFARTPEKGAETLIWLATSPEAAQHNGQYFHDKKLGKLTAIAKDDALAGKLWEFSEKLVGA